MAKKEWEVLQQIADAATPEFRRAFLDAVMQAQGDVSTSRMATALDRGDVDTAYRMAVDAWESNGEEWRKATARQLNATLNKAGRAAEQFLPRSISISFDVTNPEAVRWAAQRSSELLGTVSADTQKAIRRLITRGFQEGIPVREIARDLQRVIGLTESQAASIVKYRAGLAAQAERVVGGDLQDASKKRTRGQRIPARRGLTSERIDQLVDRYRTRLLRQRAETIARTETMAASNRGQQELWRQGVREGTLDANRTQRKFIVTPDDRLCPVCAPMAGQLRGLNEPFSSANGPRLVPPIHHRCRCAVGLQITRKR